MYAAVACQRCSCIFTPRSGRQRFCSEDCRLPVQTCRVCGSEFKTKNFKTQVYCSKKCAVSQRDMCYVNSQIKNRRGGTPRAKTCEECKQSYRPTSSRQRYCSTCVTTKADRARMRRYGVTTDGWREMVAKHDGRCWLCLDRPATCLDHCHATGKVRGALCRICNMALHFVERPDWWDAAQHYLKGGTH